jgi:hypothetical protein
MYFVDGTRMGFVEGSKANTVHGSRSGLGLEAVLGEIVLLPYS